MPALSLLLEPPNLVITMCKQFTACPHGIGAIFGVRVRASELASAAQLSSGGSCGAALQTEDGNGSDGGGGSGVERARCQW